MKIYPGFASYEFGGKDELFLALHSTTNFDSLPRGDVGSDLISLKLAKERRQAALISLLPRNREFGVDLNRLKPSLEDALKCYSIFLKSCEGANEFRRKYAWVARTKKQHKLKESIYEGFWREARRLSSEQTLNVFIHTQATLPNNMPSLIDVVAFNLQEDRVERTIEKTNKDLEKEIAGIKDKLSEYVEKELRIRKRSFTQSYKKTLTRLRKLEYEDLAKRLETSKDLKLLEEIAKEMIKRAKLGITYKMNFDGSLSYGTKQFLGKNRKGIQAEVCSYLSEANVPLAIKSLNSLLDYLLEI